MKKLILLLAVLCLFGCEEKKPTSQKDIEATWLHYYKDSRTSLCFAGDPGEHLGHDHSHLTAVPCDSVERFLEPWPEPSY